MRAKIIVISAAVAGLLAAPVYVAGSQQPAGGSAGPTCEQAIAFVREQVKGGVDLISVYERDEIEWARDIELGGTASCRPVPANLVDRYRGLPPSNGSHKRMNCHLAIDALLARYSNDFDAMPMQSKEFLAGYIAAIDNGQACPEIPAEVQLLAKGHSLQAVDNLFLDAAKAGDSNAALEIALFDIQNGQPQAGMEALKFSADLGNPWANLQLAELYRNGWGVEADPAESHRHTLLAAEAGLNWAMLSAGRNLELGYGTARDPAKAIEWYRKAAEQGHLGALPLAAALLEKGDGVRKDREKAYDLLRTAAGAGDTNAMAMLGAMLLKRNDGDVSEEGLSWIDKAYARGNPVAVKYLSDHGDWAREHFANLSERQSQRRQAIREGRAKQCTNTVNYCVTYVSRSNYSSQRICNSGIDYWNC